KRLAALPTSSLPSPGTALIWPRGSSASLRIRPCAPGRPPKAAHARPGNSASNEWQMTPSRSFSKKWKACSVSAVGKLFKVGTLWSWIRTYRNWPVALKLSMFGSTEMSTIQTRDGVKVLVRPETNDFGIFNSVYAGHNYNPPGFEIQPDYTVLDI